MRIINVLNTPFFLTGGTALSRHYFHYRYSDDLDLFVNDCDQYHELLDTLLQKLSDSPRYQIEHETLQRSEYHTQLFLIDARSASEVRLKIDFVNDLAPHYGQKETHDTLGVIDGWQNILSNKISALFRFEPKDVADLWVIAKNKSFNWKRIMREAKTKEAGCEPEEVFNIIKSFPIEELRLVKWVEVPDRNAVKNDLEQIADDIFWGRENSLI